MHPNKFSVGSWQSAVSNPDSQLTPIFLPCKLPTANFFLNSALSTRNSALQALPSLHCQLPTIFSFAQHFLSALLLKK